MIQITSTSNPTIKHVRRLLTDRRYRHKQKAYIVEGSRWLYELKDYASCQKQILATQSWLDSNDNQRILESLGSGVTLVTDRVMSHISESVTPPGVLAELRFIEATLPPTPSLLLILDGITNPGNLGSIIRSASAAGADGILLAPGCVDVYNPKVVQGSMGALLKVPFILANWEKIRRLTEGMEIWLATMDAELSYSDVNWKLSSVIIIGGEAKGYGAKAKNLAKGSIRIPMYRVTESLNAATAASVIIFEAARQRRS